MFNRKNEAVDALDKVINHLHKELEYHEATSEKYAEVVKRLEELYKIRAMNQPETLTPDTVFTATTYAAMTLLILHYEKLGVITSRAFGLFKLR